LCQIVKIKKLSMFTVINSQFSGKFFYFPKNFLSRSPQGLRVPENQERCILWQPHWLQVSWPDNVLLWTFWWKILFVPRNNFLGLTRVDVCCLALGGTAEATRVIITSHLHRWLPWSDGLPARPQETGWQTSSTCRGQSRTGGHCAPNWGIAGSGAVCSSCHMTFCSLLTFC
jgi:hypothetical protein